jgi:trehalose/maltose hydrolase-like predicted phosphorylase
MNDRWTNKAPCAILRVSPTDDPAWQVEEDGFSLAREHEIESLFATSNGYVGSRGALPEGSALSNPATYIAGVFDVSNPGDVPELAAAPDWMQRNLLVDGQELRLDNGDFLYHRRVLDLRQAILWREFACKVEGVEGVIRLFGCRLASLADQHVLLQSIGLIPEGHFTRLHFRVVTAPAIERPGQVRLYPEHSSPLETDSGAAHVLELHTRHTGIQVAVATTGRLWIGQELAKAHVEWSHERHIESWEVAIESGKHYRLDRIVVIYTSRDCKHPGRAATRHLARLLNRNFEKLIEAHVRAWDRRWRMSDVKIDGDEKAQRAVRFACYHLICAANPDDARVSVGARALTGAAYKGHVFWDTEIFMLPFYVFTHPPSARALLMYRWHTLPAARTKARQLGYRGALYAWESTSTGEEDTPGYSLTPDGEINPILNGVLEQHISADIAYAVWQYWQATADETFLLRAGAEILFETARFWASRGGVEADGHYHIREFIGPDEYHEGIDDNAFTNGMAQWNLECAAETAHLLAERWPDRWLELACQLGVVGDEPETWRDLARRMYTGFDAQPGLFEQFHGYFGLEEIDLAQYAPHLAPIDVLLGRERIQLSKIVKQADVVMLIYLLWDRFPPEAREANFRYYEPRTSHGSSLSPSIHAAVAARLGDHDTALRYFRQAAEIDLADNMGNAAGGVHAAALGGLWQAVVFGFAGMRLLPDGLAFLPHVPAAWAGVRFSVLWRNSRLDLQIRPRWIEVAAAGETAVPIQVGDAPRIDLRPGESRRWREAEGQWREALS